jgi:DNA-binding transcriptional regulator of glucitol operon
VRQVLRGKWWLLHVGMLAAVLVQLRLGLWQWHRAESPTGGIQNYAYAFQWPLFALFTVFLWGRTIHETLHRDPEAEAAKLAAAVAAPDSELTRRNGVVVGRMTQSDPADNDEELAAWNARFAALHAATAAVESRRR